ncbi:PREDICTED: transcription cofactor HES-6 [Condylura cristata]|uniref:transcription cofactor HES-6 n=1 Tax=Condylura cristata TaxID=143302 RepID=UPI000642ACCF|nr:PREDICTED: transcription cofactor HES-6 [Condylura cristata]
MDGAEAAVEGTTREGQVEGREPRCLWGPTPRAGSASASQRVTGASANGHAAPSGPAPCMQMRRRRGQCGERLRSVQLALRTGRLVAGSLLLLKPEHQGSSLPEPPDPMSQGLLLQDCHPRWSGKASTLLIAGVFTVVEENGSKVTADPRVFPKPRAVRMEAASPYPGGVCPARPTLGWRTTPVAYFWRLGLPQEQGELSRVRAPAGWAADLCGRTHRSGAALSLPPLGTEREQLQAEASERFAAGYIQCMHEVHTFVSTCQAIDATVAAELLNHLLESMPLREGSSFRDLLGDALAGPVGTPGLSCRPAGGLPSPQGPSDDQCSDLEEAPEAELSQAPAEGLGLVPMALGSLTTARPAQSVWRPW